MSRNIAKAVHSEQVMTPVCKNNKYNQRSFSSKIFHLGRLLFVHIIKVDNLSELLTCHLKLHSGIKSKPFS